MKIIKEIDLNLKEMENGFEEALDCAETPDDYRKIYNLCIALKERVNWIWKENTSL